MGGDDATSTVPWDNTTVPSPTAPVTTAQYSTHPEPVSHTQIAKIRARESLGEPLSVLYIRTKLTI